MLKSSSVLIIGAGLSGLTLAYYLKKAGIKSIILEARKRTGGRILTNYQEANAPIELGATWLGKKHQYLNHLLDQLGINTFEQKIGPSAIYEPISTSPPQLAQLPPNDEPSYRIGGGSSNLIKKLADQLEENQLMLGKVVQAIDRSNEKLIVQTQGGSFLADYVVSTLPPKLLLEKVQVPSNLSTDLKTIASQTHTWMGESIKVGLRYTTPFWRSAKTSGTIFSNVGPVSEMYDHSDESDKTYALKGFMNGSYHSATSDFRKELILKQLEKYFGPPVFNYLSYEEKIWSQEEFTFVPYESYILPHQNNGNPVFQKAYLDGRFFIAGSETATAHPGYMDGAVSSALGVAEALLAQ